MEFSEVACESYPEIHFGEFNLSYQKEFYGNDTHGWNGFVNGEHLEQLMSVTCMIALNLVMRRL